MKKQWFRLCCLILVIVMTANSLPLTVFAEEYQSNKNTPQEASTVTEQFEQPNADYSDAQIVEENIANRTEFSKEFLLDNGVSLAVLYDSAVHYEKDGKWEEIDNTLQAKSNGTLTNKAGIWDVAFPQQLSSNNQISITKDGYTLSFGMAGELRQQGNLEVMSTGEEALINESKEPTPTIAPEKETVADPSTEATIPEETTSVETTSDDPVSKETISQETEANREVPVEGTLEVVTPEEIVTVENEQEVIPQESTAEETEPVETIPTETIPEETTQVEEIPKETIPKETTQEETIPEETVSEITEFPELEENAPTASVMINGAAQTFAVSAMSTARGQIQTIDRKEVLAEVDHAETVLEKPVSKLLYADVYTNTDVQYDLVGNQVKESIIMDSYNDALRGYQFRLNTGKLVPVLAADNHIDFYDESKENIVMVMPAPYLVDDKLIRCDDVLVNLSGADGSYLLTYILPQQWLVEEDRAWPVVLDPAVYADIHVTNIRDRSIAQKFSPNYQYEINQVGVGLSYGAYRSLVQYSNLPALTSSDVILKATISMRKYSSYNNSTVVEVHKVNDTWSSTASMNWNTMPDCDNTVEDYVQIGSGTVYTWDITDIARGWYAGANTGMMFKVPNATEAQTSTASWVQFYSSDNYAENRPSMTIYFRNNNGLESYWDYTSSSAGRAGTAHINQYTGNLVWVHNDLGFGGNRMPVSISHVYNANDTSVTHYGMGNGWRTNFNQRVYLWDYDSDYYIWEDADGTKHYFPKATAGVYKDEDGLELTLTNTGSGTSKFCITDKYGNKSFFDTYGRLTKQENNQATKSSISITYTTTSGYLIQAITDGVGRRYDFTYNTSNLLNKITYVGNGSVAVTVSYGYTNGNLTSVTYQDGRSTAFAYGTNNLLTSATDIDGYALKFEYNTTTVGQPSRVSKISEFDGSAAGGVMNFEYAHNQTTCTDHNGNVQILQFNNMGNTVCIQDGEGHAQYAEYAIDDQNNDSNDHPKGNQLTASSKLQNTVGNLLKDSSFEHSTVWIYATYNVTQSISSDDAYHGSKSLKMTRSTAGTATGVCSDAITAAAGETYTFSAYVRTTGEAYLLLGDGSTSVISEKLNQDEWTRLEVSYTNTSSSAKSIRGRLITETTGTTYMDCAQIEKAPTASRYNMVQNGDFAFSGSPAQYWTGSGIASTDVRASVGTSAAPQLDTNVMKIEGSPTAAKKISQTIPVSGSNGDTYVIAGWAQADSVPLDADGQTREFGIRLIFNNTDGTTTPFVAQFNCDTNSTANWQYSAAAAVADKAYSSMTVEVAYEYNANTAYFDGIQLYKEQFKNSFTYSETGELVKVTDLLEEEREYTYDLNHNLIKEELPTGAQLTYVYDTHHNVTQATTATGVVYKFTYDNYGNNTDVEIINNGVSIKSSADYSDDGNRMISATDATGKTTIYDYDINTNVLKSVRYPNDSESTKTNYTYDSMYRMATAAATTNTGLALSASYTYTDDMLTAIQTGTTTYTFVYGDFALRNSVKVGSRTLANYTYTDRDNYLASLDYGNNDRVEYEYDQQGRVTKQTYEDGDTVTYRYDNDGALATVIDSASGRTTTYYYDFIDRMMKYVETGSGYNHSVGYEYNTINNLTKMVETINGIEYATEYTYDADNRVKTETRGNTIRNYTYDFYGRVGNQATNHGNTEIKKDTFSYTTPSSAATSTQVTGHTIDAASYDRTFAYAYDNNGNILSASAGNKTTTYVYDSANQLVRENNPVAGKTWLYAYDKAGNILSKSEYAYTDDELGAVQNTVNYTYGDSSWGDLLTGIGDQDIYFDSIGNPVSDGTWSYDWQHGRQLERLAGMSDNGYIRSEFTYDANGMRTQKAVTSYSLQDVGTKTGLYWCSDGELRYFTNGTPTFEGIIRDEYNNYYYISSILRAIRDRDYTVSKTNGLLESATYTFGADGRLVYDRKQGENGELFSGLNVDADGETRYYQNGVAVYAGLVLVDGTYYYINSSRKAVKNCTYTIAKTNDLLPAAAYTFDSEGRMVNPPATQAQASAASARAANAGYQVWVPGTTTTSNYVYNGDKLSQLTVGNNLMYFSYDASGTPMAVCYNNANYYYVTNIQGDVIAILNTSGAAVVEYAYDAWGNIISTTGSMASTLGAHNPLRYRGYVYDQEYGLYYLQSRYYNPETGRFLNVDALTSTGQGILGNNMYSYCQNNPVVYIDPNGLCREVGALLTWIDCKSIFCPTSSAHHPHITPPAVPASSLTATFSYGLSANANVGPTVYGVQGFITLDSQGYAALQYSVFSGVSAGPDSDKFSGGCVPFVMMTNAGNYNDLNNKGISMGASISNYAVDYVGMLDDDGKTLNYHGISISLPGVGFGGSAGNAHITGSYTGTALATLFDWDTYRKVTQY